MSSGDVLNLRDAEGAMRHLGTGTLRDMRRAISHALSLCPWQDGGTRNRMWKEQCNVNYPLLYLSCIFLHRFAQKRGCSTFLFATRDCPHFSKLFARLFPQYNVHYFHCSRVMFDAATMGTNAHYNKYVEDLLLQTDGLNKQASRTAQLRAAVSKTVYIDVHGAGKRTIDYFEKQFSTGPNVFLITTLARGRHNLEDVCKTYYDKGKLKTLAWNTHGAPIEQLNYDIVGTLQGFNKSGPVRDTLEYKLQYVTPYHRCFDALLSVTFAFSMASLNHGQLRESRRTLHSLCKTLRINKPIVSKYVRHVRVHKKKRQ